MMKYDYIIIGAGIVGLTLAKELHKQYPKSKIVIVEKEKSIGLHASGRNSGVLHSGIYYPADSLKAKLCTKGYELLKQYCLENNLALDQCGKVVVCAELKDLASLELIYQRALDNNVQITKINKKQLLELEPHANTAGDQALYVPGTAVFNPLQILEYLKQDLRSSGIEILFESEVVDSESEQSLILVKQHQRLIKLNYGHMFNTAGLFADVIAKKMGLDQYTIMPFKGIYCYLSNLSKFHIKKLIYPAPDINLPFLGVHVTKNINNQITVGPSAFPALGRENYQGLDNIKFNDALNISKLLIKQYFHNKNNFRNFAHNELCNYLNKNTFLNNIKKIMPAITKNDISAKWKVGIRAQLLDLDKQELIMDLVVENKYNTTHVLNAVSPAFTCSFALAQHILNT